MRLAIFPLLLLTTIGFGADIDSKSASSKTVATPVEFKSASEYDEEAKVRISGFTLPKEIKASLYADSSQIQNPSAICFDRDGKLYVAEIHRWRAGVQDIRNEQQILLDDIDNRTSEDRLEMYERDVATRPVSFYSEFEDRIVVVDDTDDDGRADTYSVFADGFNDPLDGPGIGLVAGPENEIYYTNIPHLWKLTDTDGDGKADQETSLQDGFGVRMSISGHDMHGVIWGPDGKLYWSIGDRGFHFTTKEGRHYDHNYEGGVFRCDPDGSNLEMIYRGLRNPQELAFDKYGNLFTCDNDADQWDKGRLVYILEGGDSGWHHGHQVILNFRNQLELRTPDYEHPGHKTIPMSPWMAEGIWENLHDRRPAFALPPVDIVSWGPSGLVYNYGATSVPERYADHFWICNFGGANGDLEAFTVEPKGAGFSLGQHEKYMVGLGNTDVEFGPDGRMYLSCFNNNGWYKQDLGNIYALEAREPGKTELLASTEKLLTSDFKAKVESEVASLLAHPDMRVRQFAQFDLVRRGSKSVFLDAIAQTQNQLQRLHGIWGLGQLARSDESLLKTHVELLSDSDAEVRAQAAKILADTRSDVAGEALLAAMDDESARVRSFAAIGVGKCGNELAFPKLLEMLAANADEDVYLRHAAVQGLWGLNEREKMLKETKNESRAVRLGILLTLRKLEDPRVKYFLNDEDKFIREEAIRTINDLDLLTALPDLAKMIEPYANSGSDASLPADHRDWLTHCRILNANFRVGTPENAAHLLAYAANDELPSLLREQALKAVKEWKNPTPVDPTNGFFRPLDSSSRSDITGAVREGLPAVFDSADGVIVGLATDIALEYGVDAPEELLTRLINDEKAEVEARINSLNGLARQNASALDGLWDKLLKSDKPAFKAAVVDQLHESDSERAVSVAVQMANSDQHRTRQKGYHLLAGFDAPAANELFRKRLENIANEKPGALLDLLEGAEQKKSDESIAKLLGDYNASIDATNPMAAFHSALEGGDAKSGKEIFMTHAAGQCSKCHKIDGDGGIAGPELTGIGSRHKRAYLLEALVDPSKVVVPGYGMTLVSLKSGESIGGALLEESDSEIVLKLPDPEDATNFFEKRIALSEIESRQPPVSAMPPMGYLLKKSEIRDLVAFLDSLKEKGAKKGH